MDLAGGSINMAQYHDLSGLRFGLGGNGYINDYPTGRFWLDAKIFEIGAGTSDIRRILIGREIFRGAT
jgi:alkylation response protein AidB-like acyl-CoA dehydrogenase